MPEIRGEMPKEVLDLADEMARKYPSDIDGAVREGLRVIQAREDYRRLIDLFVRKCFRRLILDSRHEVTRKAKKAAGGYDQKVGGSDGARLRVMGDVADSLYDSWFINGTVLGSILGRDLLTIAEAELERSNGSLVNYKLLVWLGKQGVEEDQPVRDAVPVKKTRVALQRIRREVFGSDRPKVANASRES